MSRALSMRSGSRPEVAGRRRAVERWPATSPPFGRCRCSVAVPSPRCSGRTARARRDGARGRRAGHAGGRREPARPVLGEQAERAGDRRRPAASDRARRRLQRQHRHGGLQRRRPTTPARSRRASACRGSTSRSTAARRWTQPTYTGLSARNCLGVPGDADPPCTAARGPIGTLPNYDEDGLVADGDPALAFGPRPAPGGGFSCAERLAALLRQSDASAVPGTAAVQGLRGDRGLAHRRPAGRRGRRRGGHGRLDATGDRVSKQSSAPFSDKEQIWADNAASSPLLRQRLRLLRRASAVTAPALSRWSCSPRATAVTAGPRSRSRRPPTTPTPATASAAPAARSARTRDGVVYVFYYQFAVDPAGAAPGTTPMVKSFDGGDTLDAAGRRLHRLRHLQRVRAVDRPLRRGRRRRGAQRPVAGALGGHRQRRPHRRRRDRTGSS